MPPTPRSAQWEPADGARSLPRRATSRCGEDVRTPQSSGLWLCYLWLCAASGLLDLQQGLTVALCQECCVTAPEPEQPLGPQQIADGKHVDDQRTDAQPGDLGDDLVDLEGCLLYTSDAADDLTRVDLGGR